GDALLRVPAAPQSHAMARCTRFCPGESRVARAVPTLHDPVFFRVPVHQWPSMDAGARDAVLPPPAAYRGVVSPCTLRRRGSVSRRSAHLEDARAARSATVDFS